MSSYQLIAYGSIALTLGYLVWSRIGVSKSIAANSQMNVGQVATRLGMSVVEGDPSLNLLYFQQPIFDFKRAIRATGVPYGRAATFTLTDGRETREYLLARTAESTFGSALELESGVSLPPFEVSLRNPNRYLVPDLHFVERPGLREIATGSAPIDAQFLIRAVDARMGPAFVSALSLLSSLPYVHLIGEGVRLWMPISRIGLPYFAHAAEQYLLAMETLACGLEGRASPVAAPHATDRRYTGQPRV